MHVIVHCPIYITLKAESDLVIPRNPLMYRDCATRLLPVFYINFIICYNISGYRHGRIHQLSDSKLSCRQHHQGNILFKEITITFTK
jgi:hypothetical protein